MPGVDDLSRRTGCRRGPGETRRVCDLYSAAYIAWVDNGRGNLDVEAVENVAKVAASDGRNALVFLRGGVRPVAQQRADTLGVALLNHHATDGSLEGQAGQDEPDTPNPSTPFGL